MVDRLHPVVDVEHLALAEHLPPDRRRHRLLVVGPDIGEDRVAIDRRGPDVADLADPGQRHLQGPRDRGGGEGEHVDRGAQPLDLVLGRHPEPLLLVDDEQSQVTEPDVAGQETVGGDDDVDRAVGEPVDDAALLRLGEEPAERLDPHRVGGETLAQGGVVLLGQQRGGDQHRHLLAVLHRLHRRPHRHLGLAEADVAEHQPVHRLGGLHVRLDVGDGGELVGGLLIRERRLELCLPRGVGQEGVPAGTGPAAMEVDHLLGHHRHRLAHLGAGARPVGAAQPGQPRGLAPGVATDRCQLVGGDVQPVVAVVGDQQVVTLDPADLPVDQPLEPARCRGGGGRHGRRA